MLPEVSQEVIAPLDGIFKSELLDITKHALQVADDPVFGINGVRFVLETNMAQLSESVKAIDGANFDGYSYLKWFFNVEYALPPCKKHDHMRLLLGEYPELGSYDLEHGLPITLTWICGLNVPF